MFERKKPVGRVVALPAEQIEPSPFQARRTFDEAELAGLAASIRENGLLQPVTVRRLGPDRYELVAGERRLRACKLAGMEKIPAIIRDCEDHETAALGLLENIQRQGLDPFEQARGIREVITLWGCTQEEAAKRIGKAQADNLELIMSVPLEVSVEIGRTRRKVEDILAFSKGSLVVLDKLAGDQVDLFVNGLCVAKGDVVVIDDNFGVRITEVLKHAELLNLT